MRAQSAEIFGKAMLWFFCKALKKSICESANTEKINGTQSILVAAHSINASFEQSNVCNFSNTSTLEEHESSLSKRGMFTNWILTKLEKRPDAA